MGAMRVLKRQIKAAKQLVEGSWDGEPLTEVSGSVHIRPPTGHVRVPGPVVEIDASFRHAGRDYNVVAALGALRGEAEHVDVDGQILAADLDISLAGGLDDAFVVYTIEFADDQGHDADGTPHPLAGVDVRLKAKMRPGRALLDTIVGGLF